MRRILVDLNVVLDVLLARAPFDGPARQLLSAVERGEVEGRVAAHNVTTLHFLARRARGRAFADRCVADVLAVCGAAQVDHGVLLRATQLGWADFEDAVVAAAAEHAGCDAIVSRDGHGFARAAVPVLSPDEALAALVSRS